MLSALARLFGRKPPRPVPVGPVEPLFPRAAAQPITAPPAPVAKPAAPAVSPYLLVAADFLAAGNHATAEAILAEGLRRQPGDGDMLVLRARSAEAAGDLAAAAAHWQSAAATRPDDPAAPLRAGAILLRQLHRPDEAEALLAAAIQRFPDDIKLAAEFAWSAEVRKDFDSVVLRYQRAQEIEPNNATWVAARAAGLRDLARFDEADAVLEPVLRNFEPIALVYTVYAWIAHYRTDWNEALRRWSLLRTFFPDDLTSAWMSARILSDHLQQPAAAEAILEAAIAQHPDDLRLAIDYAKLPSTTGNWEGSLQRWDALAHRHPTNASISAGRGEAELQIQIRAMDQAGSANEVAQPDDPAQAEIAIPRSSADYSFSATVPGSEHRDLMLTFESLGLNCEFGLVQRYFGAEPLGLMRWNAIHPESLAIGLEQRFEGIGAPENVSLTTLNGEYIVSEKRFQMAMHTFLNEKDTTIPPEKLLLQFCRRLRFLRDKLLEDLREGEKIFVYQYPRLLTDAEIARIEAAIRGLGPATILFVNDRAEGVPIGHVTELRPGCLVGHIDRLVRDEGWKAISTTAWLTVCENAARLHTGRTSRDTPP